MIAGPYCEVDEAEVVVPAAGDVLRLDGEQGQAGLIGLAGQEDEHDDGRDDGDVPPDADLVEQRDEVDAGDVHAPAG